MSFLRPLGLLIGLRVRLAVRGYLTSKPALVGAALLLLVSVPASFRVATVLGTALTGPQAESALVWALVGIFTLFCFAPLVTATALPDAGDPSRLMLYPVRPQVLTTALALASLAELSTVLALPPLMRVLGYGGWAQVPGLLALVLCALVVGQALLFAGGALARSRRVKEALTLSLPFVLAFALVLAARQPAQAARLSSKPTLTVTAPPTALAFTPPGLAATARQQPLVLLGLLAWTAGALVLAGRLAEAQVGKERGSGGNRPRVGLFRLPLAGPTGALAAKELTYYLREPSFRVALSRSSATLVAVGVITLYPTNAPRFLWDSTLGVAGVLYSVLWVLERACNAWGSDAAAGRLLWAFPGVRGRWVVGKNAGLLPVLLGLELFFLGEFALIARPSAAAWWGFLGYGALWLVNSIALGNVVSARLPFPVLGPAAQQNAGQSFGTGLLYLGVGAIAAYLMAVPLAPLWTLALWSGSVVWAGRILERRELEVIQALQ